MRGYKKFTKKQSVTFDFEGELGRFLYDPMKLTAFYNEYEVDSQSDSVLNRRGLTVGIICASVVSWNVEDEDGQRLPITPECVAMLTDERPLCVAAATAQHYKALSDRLSARLRRRERLRQAFGRK